MAANSIPPISIRQGERYFNRKSERNRLGWITSPGSNVLETCTRRMFVIPGGVDTIFATLLNRMINGRHLDNVDELRWAWFTSPAFGHNQAIQGIRGAALLGQLFALSFRPVSAALLFGSLIAPAVDHNCSIYSAHPLWCRDRPAGNWIRFRDCRKHANGLGSCPASLRRLKYGCAEPPE